MAAAFRRVLLGVSRPSLVFGGCPATRLFAGRSVGRNELWYQSQRFLSTKGGPSLVDLMDLTLPHTWYPNARKKKRHVVMHVGPTNSGKTHTAIKRLQLCSSGVYCGPLRLLAWEVAERVNKANVACNLVTGQEKREVDGAKHTAMTVEMADVTRDYGCAIIDEIQMIGCQERGFSFTRALLGLAADELHLCGDPSAVSVVQNLLAATEDLFEVKYYNRLSPLEAMRKPLGTYSKIRKGDCVVAFSRRNIYSIKKEIETSGKLKCSVVYGSLPPETRTRQAEQFNDTSSGLDVLIASDAVGMGLNLNIRRIIFSTLEKFDGTCTRSLTPVEIKQIAGRAGRFGSMFPNGEVTCLISEDLPLLHGSLSTPSIPLKAAGLLPAFDFFALYSTLHPDMTFAEILEDFMLKARLSPDYFMCNCESMMVVAEMIQNLPLPLQDRFLFCICPVDIKDEISMGALVQFASEYAKEGSVSLQKIFTPGNIKLPRTQGALIQLESFHKVLELYIWLSLRFKDAFNDYHLALSQKELCSLIIEEGMKMVGVAKKSNRKHIRKQTSILTKLAMEGLSDHPGQGEDEPSED
ncbi:unnamed protein product [Calypogeia fissa]